MKSVTFACIEVLPLAPGEIASQILDLANWPDFKGYGPLPGIKAAEFEVHTPDVVGSRIRVTNTDGSKHVEEIAEWQLPHRLQLHMKDFSAPFSFLAARIEETWEFEPVGNETKITRSFKMQPKFSLGWPFLWMISRLLKRAITRHLRQIRSEV